jgi:hypothetical protein
VSPRFERQPSGDPLHDYPSDTYLPYECIPTDLLTSEFRAGRIEPLPYLDDQSLEAMGWAWYSWQERDCGRGGGRGRSNVTPWSCEDINCNNLFLTPEPEIRVESEAEAAEAFHQAYKLYNFNYKLSFILNITSSWSLSDCECPEAYMTHKCHVHGVPQLNSCTPDIKTNHTYYAALVERYNVVVKECY